jgi:asparagine synthase (glutamine-hydrolysing)
MCGIAGVIHPDPSVVGQALTAATAAQSHRGPDDGGTAVVPFGASALGLGHRRLSIIDLSPLGHQPMRHPRTQCLTIFNGEIYNFQRLRQELERDGDAFQSHSDTEVVLAGLTRYGAAFLTRLEGMYALAFFDPRSGSLLLARDPAGIKPLYLATFPGGLAFASEVRALLATGLVQARINRRGVAGFLAYGAVQHPCTLMEGVWSLPPGSHLTIEASRTDYCHAAPQAFWRLPASEPAWTETRAVDAIRAALDAAVRDHLIADVPVGLFLSSGLDSTILAGLAARHAPALRSFTVVFADQPDFSEQALAAGTARQFGMDHTEIALPMAAAEAAAGAWLAALDQPSIDGLNVFVISRVVQERGLKVALTGLGGDELFGGYPSFRDVPRLRRLMRLVRPLPAGVRRGLAGVASVGRTTAVRAKLRDMLGGDGSLRSLYCQRRRAMSNRQLAQLGLDAGELGLDRDFLPLDAAPDIDADDTDPVRAIGQLEFRLYQGNMLLRDADTNGMAFGLELRVPFLDQRLLNLAHAIPGCVRLPAGAPGKHLLRTAFGDLLRPEILAQRKRGFTLPLRRWMLGSLRPACERALRTLKDSKLLNPGAIDAVWQGFLAEPETPLWSRALALVALGAFVARHDTVPSLANCVAL